jgi:G3E family GTPase
MAALRGEEASEADEYGFGSFVYRARRPFHPERFHTFMRSKKEGVVRSKGFFWLASRPDWMGYWAQAGRITEIGPAGFWWDAVVRAQWPEDAESKASIRATFEKPWGDRRQELVFIGHALDQEALTAGLDAALLTEAEVAIGKRGWKKLPDPIDDWQQSEAADA